MYNEMYCGGKDFDDAPVEEPVTEQAPAQEPAEPVAE